MPSASPTPAVPAPGPIALRPAARHLLLLAAGEGIAKALAFAATAYLGRTIGPEGFGALAFAAAVVAYFSLIPDFGLKVFGVRELARGADPRRLGGEVTALRLALGIGATLLFVAFVPALSAGRGPVARSVLLGSGLQILTYAAGLTWIYQGIERMGVVAASGAATQGLYAAGIFLLVRTQGDVVRVPLLQAAAEAVVIAATLALLARGGIAPRLALSPARAVALVRETVPLAWTRVLRVLLYNADVVLLGFLFDPVRVGLYSAGYRIVYALLAVNELTGTALLPRISRAAGESKETVSSLLTRLGYATVAVNLPMALGLSLLAKPIMVLCFGPRFADAGRALGILAWVVVILPLGENFRRVLWAFNLQSRDVGGLAAAAATMVALCFTLIPRFGLPGAATATIAAEAVLLVAVALAVRSRIAPFALLTAWRAPLVSALAMALAVRAAGRFGLAVAIPAGALAYLASLALQKGIPTELIVRKRGGTGS